MRQIIILNNQLNQDKTQTADYVFWISIPVSQQVPNPSAVSLVPDITQSELSALQSGAIIEMEQSSIFTATQDMAAKAISDFNTIQAYYNSKASIKKYSGAYYDGTWHNLPA